MINTNHKTIDIPNLLLIAGNGRNVGKTTLACQIISYFVKTTEVIGLKISPHQHTFNQSNVIFKNDKIVILEEKQINSKDSSLMLRAGAKKVFFVMVKPEHLNENMNHLIKILTSELIVCESGGLREHINPGVFLKVKRKEEEIIKKHLLKYNPIIVNNDGNNFDFDIQQLGFKNHQIRINK